MVDMLRVCLVLLHVCVITATFQQTDYILKMERIEIASSNESYINAHFHNFKFNRTHWALNGTMHFKTDLGNSMKVSVQGYRFASNEYRLFPITFTVNFCETLKKNDFGIQNMYKCGNPPKCPMVKGHYSMCNWTPDYSKFPPYIPHGRYRMDVKFIYEPVEFFHYQWFLMIEDARPLM